MFLGWSNLVINNVRTLYVWENGNEPLDLVVNYYYLNNWGSEGNIAVIRDKEEPGGAVYVCYYLMRYIFPRQKSHVQSWPAFAVLLQMRMMWWRESWICFRVLDQATVIIWVWWEIRPQAVVLIHLFESKQILIQFLYHSHPMDHKILLPFWRDSSWLCM